MADEAPGDDEDMRGGEAATATGEETKKPAAQLPPQKQTHTIRSLLPCRVTQTETIWAEGLTDAPHGGRGVRLVLGLVTALLIVTLLWGD